MGAFADNVSLGFNQDSTVYNFEVDGAPVPEPATMVLFGIGLLGLAGITRRKKQ